MLSTAKKLLIAFKTGGVASTPAPNWGLIVALALAYFLAGKLGLSYAALHSSASAVWPPTGIAIGAMLIAGFGVWPAVFVGAFLVNITTAGSVFTSLGIATGNTLEALVGAWLVLRFAGGAECFDRARDIFKFALLAALVSTTLSATTGVASLSVGGYADWGRFGPIWLTWWLGDACGALIVTPLLVLWWRKPRTALTKPSRAEALWLLWMVVGVGLLVFAVPGLRNYPLAYLCLPPLAWAAFRFGPREVATAVGVLTVIATGATDHGWGPFVMPGRNESLLILQSFMATMALMTLPIAALVAEHGRAVAEREALRAAAERNHTWLTTMLDQMQVAVLIADAPSGRVVYANRQAQAISGRRSTPAPSQVDRHHWQGFHADGRAYLPHEWPLARSVHQGEIVEGEDIELMRDDGTRVTVRAHSAPVREAGRIIGAVVAFHDVTEQLRHERIERNARAQAEASNRAKDEFLAMLGHELRNPLQGITNSATLLRQARGNDEIESRAHAIINRQTAHLTRLVNDLLDVTRVMTGKIKLECSVVDLDEILRHCNAQLADAMRMKHHTVELQASPVRVHGDPVRLEQVFTNLLANALRYTAPGGRIRTSLQHTGGEAIVTVEDNGTGISADLLPRVFEPFVQSERSLERGEGGLGIGLTLVRRLVELHGGQVQAHSDGPGTGSRFVVRLPSVAAPTRDASTAQPQARPASEPRRVLVVEDNADARESLSSLLTLGGHEVLEAADGEAGLELALRLRPAVALVDIGLPRMDGYEFARRLRARGASLWLVALTGYGQPADRQRSQEAGFDDHLVKPITADVLERAMRCDTGAPHSQQAAS